MTRGHLPKALSPALGMALLLGAGGCAPHGHWQGLREELAALEERRTPPTARGAWLDLRGALHVHSEVSRDSEGTPEEILSGARAAGLDFLVMTDHATPEIFSRGLHGRHGDILVIRGMEIITGCEGMADRCTTLLAIGLEEWFDPEPLALPEIVAEVRRQGGLPFVAHPKGWQDWSIPGLAGLEIYDVLDDTLEELWMLPKWALDVLYSHDRYPDEVALQILDRPDYHLAVWDQLVQSGRRWVGVAGNDAHQNQEFLGRQIDPYSLGLRVVTTHVWTRARDEAALLEGLADGHAYVAFDRLADATGFWFASADTGPAAVQGDELPWRAGLEIAARAPLPGRIELFRSGEPIARCLCDRLRHSVSEPGVYRVEVSLRIQDRWWPWILSNPLYVR